MNILQLIAERKIDEAIKEGRLKIDGWQGRPLPDDADPYMPEDLKMAYKILKNAGFVPPEVETRREIERLEEIIAGRIDEQTRLKQMKKLEVLLRKLAMMRPEAGNIALQEEYYRKIVERVSVHTKNPPGGGSFSGKEQR
ncbi:MAG: DUF1992 domain-containing protein [Deltaproteobacteria bacterium]